MPPLSAAASGRLANSCGRHEADSWYQENWSSVALLRWLMASPGPPLTAVAATGRDAIEAGLYAWFYGPPSRAMKSDRLLT
jgi:hypothetical protein